jgi:hypothetical protein
MILRKIKDPSIILRVGMAFLLAGIVGSRIHPSQPFWGDVTDGVSGLLFGVAFGLLLCVAVIQGRNRRTGSPC